MSVLSHYTQEQLMALNRLYQLVQQHFGTSGGNTAAKILLGLYNGRRFPFDLTDLRTLDEKNLRAALVVIEMDAARTWAEVHVVLDALRGISRGTQAELEHWAYDMGLKGRCKRDQLPSLATSGAL